MITVEQKRRLKKLQVEINPEAESDEYVFDEIDRLEDKVMETRRMINKELELFFERMSKIVTEKMSKLESKIDAMVVDNQQVMSRMIQQSRSEILALIPDVDKAIDGKLPSLFKKIDQHKKANDQIIEEIRGEIKIAYSKFGGATMPRLLQVETASGTNDGSNLVYTVKNDPLYMEVGGQIQSIQNGGYTKSGSAPAITITFAFPPPSGQVPNSYYQ